MQGNPGRDLLVGTTSDYSGHESPSLLSASGITVLLAVILCVTYFAFGNNTLNGDGLRYLPALRTITGGSPPKFDPKPWMEIYRFHYDRVAAHHHVLFGITVRAAFALQQKLGVPGDAVIAMRAVNALSAAVAGALFFLLAVRVGTSKWLALALTLGMCMSPAYLYAATNLAEVGIALPFFVGTLLILARNPFAGWTAAAAGTAIGLASISYLLAGALVPCILVALVFQRLPAQTLIRAVLFFLTAFGFTFFSVWVIILLGSGFHTPDRLIHLIVHFPEQGTYGKMKLGSLIATPVGFTAAFFPILPADFLGLRSLYHQGALAMFIVGTASVLVCVFLAWIVCSLFKWSMLSTTLVMSSLLTLLLVEAVCMWWDPYYVKLQLFALVLFWVVVATFSSIENRVFHSVVLLFVAVVFVCGLWTLRNNLQPSRARANAQQLNAIIGNAVVVTGWNADAAHLWLYENGDNIIPLPDFAFARGLKSDEVKKDMEAIIRDTTRRGGMVYFYGLFGENGEGPADVYETRFRLTGFTEYLRGLARKAKFVVRLPQADGHSISLYRYVP